MAQREHRTLVRRLQTGFLTEQDPMKARLEWLLTELMKIETDARLGAPRDKHSGETKTYFSGYRVRRLASEDYWVSARP
jgi:hypothetical protein